MSTPNDTIWQAHRPRNTDVRLISAALACLPDLTIYLSQDLAFYHPVQVGDHVTATVTAIVSEIFHYRSLAGSRMPELVGVQR